MNFYKKIAFFTVLVSCVCISEAQKKNDDEGRAYEFGFKIDGQQHRHEKKDENGIIQGEFGFVTADGIYHVTVYATDENGNFKILSMKNVRISAPLDGSPGPGPSADAKSVQGQTGQQSQAQPLPLQLPEPKPSQAPVQQTQQPTMKKPYEFTTQPTIKPACAGCGYVTTSKPVAGQPFPFQTPAFQNNANNGSNGIQNTENQGSGATSQGTSQGNLQGGFQATPQGNTQGGFNGVSQQQGGAPYVSSINGQDNQVNYQAGKNQEQPNQGGYLQGGVNQEQFKQGGYAGGVGQGNFQGGFTGSQGHPGGLSGSQGQPGGLAQEGLSGSPGQPSLAQGGLSGSQGQPGGLAQGGLSSSQGKAAGNIQGGVNVALQDKNQEQNAQGVVQGNLQGNTQGAFQGNQPANTGKENSYGENTGSQGSTTANGFGQQGSGGVPQGPDGLQPNPLAIPEVKNQGFSTLPPIAVKDNTIQVGGKNPQTIEIKDKFPGMSEGLPEGIDEKDITNLLYKFHYTVGFHGHWEKGLKNGAKVGGYFVNGRDGLSRIVTYVADENGYRPKFKFVRLGLDSDETPKEGSEKTFGLKSFEFVWYPISS